jgi:A/G-specific adenine glycosylase
LKEAAAEIVKRGEFPQTVKELRKLKGIGPYTSRSILIFAFNKDLAAVDTNIRRVFIASGFANETMSEKQLQEIAEDLLLRGRSRDWHNALMDYGSSVLTSSVTGIEPVSKQSKFAGSTRQARGAVIRILSQDVELDVNELTLYLEREGIRDVDLSPVLETLVHDNLLECTTDDRFKIVE